MKNYGSKFLLLCALSFAVSGCGTSFLSARESNPVIQDSVPPNIFADKSLDIFGTTASRRLIIVSQASDGNELASCAEPPPDVGEAFSAAISAGVDQSIALQQGADTSLGGRSAGTFLREASTMIAPLLYRTQGLQLYRDAQYSMCVDVLSKRMEPGDYLERRAEIFDKAVALIKIEAPLMLEAQKAFFQNVKPFGLTVPDAAALLNAAKPTVQNAQIPNRTEGAR